MKVLIACEESQRVCTEFRKRGHEAYSCDIQRCSGGHPEWHILDNVLNVLGGGGRVKMQNGKWLDVDHWDLIIAHPPCTYLSNVATRHHSKKMTMENRIEGRTIQRIQAMDFFMRSSATCCTSSACALDDDLRHVKKCSNCGYDFMPTSLQHYCPCCGAKMDEEAEK